MRKIYLFALLFCLLPFLGHAQQPAGTALNDEAVFGPGPVSKTLPSHIQMNNRDASDEIWAHAMFVSETNHLYGYYYSIYKNGDIVPIMMYNSYYFSAAEYYKPYPATDDDEVFPVWGYASDLTQGFHRLMFETGNDNNTLSPVTQSMTDMAYDYQHDAPGREGRMLGVHLGKIYMVNLDWGTEFAGEVELLYDPADHEDIGRPVALACNLAGEVFFVSLSEDGVTSSKLYRFESDDENLEDPIEVGDLGWPAQHIQTMAFDHGDGDRLYWWQCDKDNNTNIVEIDPETATTTLVAATGNTEMAGLVFEFHYRPYTVYCVDNTLGEIRLKDGTEYTLTEQGYLPMETVEFKATSTEGYTLARIKVLKHGTDEVVLTLEAADLVDGAGVFTMPAYEVDLVGEWDGSEHGITYEWTPDDVPGLDINGPAVGNYNELVTFNYMTDFNGYILTDLTAQSGETSLRVRKLTPNEDGKRQIKMPNDEVVITGVYEAIELEQLENICQYTPAQVPAYNTPSGVTKAELKVRKPGADWTLFSDEDWADGEVFDVAGIWQYRVELTNIYGTFAEELSFEVYAAPKGIAVEGTELVCEGGELLLSVVPDPAETDMSAGTFQWFKDGEEIAGATEAQLVVNPATTADAGSYTVSYSTGDGLCQFDSEGFEVSIPALPEITWLQPTSDTLFSLLTEEYQLAAEPAGGVFTYSLADDLNVSYTIDNGILNPSELGIGEYQLTYEYTNEIGCVTTSSLNITVKKRYWTDIDIRDNDWFNSAFIPDPNGTDEEWIFVGWYISTPEQLGAFAAFVNYNILDMKDQDGINFYDFANDTVFIANDIDLREQPYLFRDLYEFKGVLEGDGHVIMNATLLEDQRDIRIKGQIRNLGIKDAKATSVNPAEIYLVKSWSSPTVFYNSYITNPTLENITVNMSKNKGLVQNVYYYGKNPMPSKEDEMVVLYFDNTGTPEYYPVTSEQLLTKVDPGESYEGILEDWVWSANTGDCYTWKTDDTEENYGYPVFNELFPKYHKICYHEEDNYNFPENYTLDGAQQHTVGGNSILYGVAGDDMTLSVEVPECNHLVSMDINARDESGMNYTIYNATEPINPYTFTMPAEGIFADTYYVTVDAGWAPNEYDITFNSSGPVLNCPPTGICGEDVTVEYQNVEDYILCDFAVEGACESLIETVVSLPNQITFTMPDCAVSVFSYYEPISLEQLDDICQWQAPGVPGFPTLADYYTSYTYKVQKPGSSEWIDFTEDDWNNGDLFYVAGSWKYRVELTNDYGTFVSAEMIFAVADAPKSIAIFGDQEICENSSLFFDVMQTPAEAFLSGSIQWYKDGLELTSETSTVLFIDGYLSDAGTYTVTYTTGYCQLESEPFKLTVNPLPEVAWVEPEDGVTVAMSTESIELQATPEGGTFYYQDPAGTSGALEEITGSTFTFPAVGQYYLAYEYVDENGCANWIGDRIINVGSEVHLIDGEGGTLQNNTMETVLMPSDGVYISAIADDCMHVTSITVYKTDDHSVTVTSTTDEYIIFTMPDYDVDVVAEYEVNNHYINYMSAPNITGPFDANCGTTVSLDYNNIPYGYILTEFIADGSCETYIPLSIDQGAGECTFMMPDCDVDVTASYEPIILDDVSEFCQWDFPGAPHFTASTYVDYYYNVRKPDGSWVVFDDDDWVGSNNFDMAGTWAYYVVLSNEYGVFSSEQKTFEVIAAPKSISLVAESSYCEGNIIILNVVPDPNDFDLEGGEFYWNQNDMPFDYTTTPTLNVYASTDMAGSWNVEYFPLGGTYGVPCTFTSENIDISVSEMPNVYFETPQQLDTTVHVGSGSLELQASPAGGIFSYEDNNTGEVTELTDNVFTFPGVGEYTVTYTYTNETGCSADNYRLIHVGYQVTIEGEGGEIYLNNGSTVCNYMPGETVTVRFYNTGCYSFEGMAIAYDDVIINEPVPTTGNTITFTMPEKDVTITPNWTPVTYNITYQYTPTTVPNLDISGPTTAACGSRVNIAYKTNVAGYILISLSANDIYGIPLDVVPCEPEQANKKMFTMTDTDVTVTGTYQSIELSLLPDICQGEYPGIPAFNITAENYTDYIYKVQIPGTTSWLDYDDDDMIDIEKFDVAGTWKYKVQLTNEYGTFQSEEMSFIVYSVLESLTIQGSNTFISGGIIQLTADYTPNDAFIAGEFQWFVNGTYHSTSYDPQLSILVSSDPTAAATLAGDYTVIYSTNTATCEFVSDAFTVTLDTSKDVCNIVNNNLNVSLYPNPTSGDAKIVSDHAVIQRVTVYNLMGQTILDEEVNNTETMLHLDGVANGVYMVKVSTEEGYLMKRLVVE